MNDKDFGIKLKEIRLSSGRSVSEISSYLISLGYKASEKTIYSWEAARSQPTPDAFLDLCKFCGVLDVMTTFGYKKKPKPNGEDDLDKAELRLMSLYRNLNLEGQEKLLDYADDLVASGKYIKSDQLDLDPKKA